jgi:hypothetical protein
LRFPVKFNLTTEVVTMENVVAIESRRDDPLLVGRESTEGFLSLGTPEPPDLAPRRCVAAHLVLGTTPTSVLDMTLL